MAEMTREEVNDAIKYFKEELHEPAGGIQHKLWYDNLSEENKKYFDKAFAASEHLVWEEDAMSEEEYKKFLDGMIKIFNEVDDIPYLGY